MRAGIALKRLQTLQRKCLQLSAVAPSKGPSCVGYAQTAAAADDAIPQVDDSNFIGRATSEFSGPGAPLHDAGSDAGRTIYASKICGQAVNGSVVMTSHKSRNTAAM